jgi:ABC-type lipoprotein export system ATPase subunit
MNGSDDSAAPGSVVDLKDILQNSADETVMIAVMGVTGSGKSTVIDSRSPLNNSLRLHLLPS